MLIKRKRTRSHGEDRWLALLLATSAGILNALALSAFGFFPSHMSGNISQLSTEINSFDIRNFVFLCAILMAFISGAFVARVIVAAGIKHRLRTIYCLVLLLEGVALTLMSLFELLFSSSDIQRQSIILLAFLMGIHNANATQLSNGRVRATHITGTVTDAGIALGSMLATLKCRDALLNHREQRKVLYTHFTTLFSFLSGGIVGLLLYQHFGFSTMLAVGVLLIVMALAAINVTLSTARRYSCRTAWLGRSVEE